jgi:CPA1 family monovalent cation:H+ antiporter
LIDVVFGVVVLSILLQGMTIARVLKVLGIDSARAARLEYQAVRVDELAARAALHELDAIGTSTAHELMATIRAEYEDRLAAADRRLRALHLSDSELAEEEKSRIHYQLAIVEKNRVLEAIRHGTASEEAAAELLGLLDARLVRLQEGAEP